MKSNLFVAFIRGINVGGNSIVPMERLRAAFAQAGFTEVKTILNSGNVIFSASESNKKSVLAKIDGAMKKIIDREISVLLLGAAEIKKIILADPFKNIDVTKQTRLYVTFFSEAPAGKVNIPYESDAKDLKILRAADGAAFSVVTITPNSGTVDAMSFLEKEFGKKVTTRNWNTIVKVAKVFQL